MISCDALSTDLSKPCTGILTDVLRFSLHDGPGIRTTAFFKGCPLRCAWCHNPETQSSAVEIEFREDKCQKCGDCLRANGVEPKPGESFDRNRCPDIHRAVEACPSGALRIVGRPWTVDEVTTEALKDSDYYAASGGGITLSGGEPLAQFEFASALLAAAQRCGIHTCVETCGHVPSELLLAILPQVDLLLFDWKFTDPERHRAETGVPNDLIRENLELAVERTAVVLRCPLIPGVNDSDDHLQGIVALAKSLPRLKGIEVMPYHSGGAGKYERYGRRSPLPGLNAPSEQLVGTWMRKLKAAPCNVTTQPVN